MNEYEIQFRHPEVLGAKRRASKGDGPSASAAHPSRLASLAPQDDGIAGIVGLINQGRALASRITSPISAVAAMTA